MRGPVIQVPPSDERRMRSLIPAQRGASRNSRASQGAGVNSDDFDRLGLSGTTLPVAVVLVRRLPSTRPRLRPQEPSRVVVIPTGEPALPPGNGVERSLLDCSLTGLRCPPKEAQSESGCG